MNAQRIPRRLAQPAVSQNLTRTSLPFRPSTKQQCRHISWFGFGGRGSNASPSNNASKGKSSNPLLADYLQQKPSIKEDARRPATGDLSKSSIFDQEERARAEEAKAGELQIPKSSTGRNLNAMAFALDPRPAQRRAWQAKMVAREVRRRGRMSRTEVLRQTERAHSETSPLMKTSVKKLGMLARQIAGKTVDEAMVQMRFSSKKAAKGILEHLEYARDSAVVRKGMGLGAIEGKKLETKVIRDKEGNKIKVADPTTIYIDQAWVNRGTYGKKPEYRARGRTNILRLPYTSLTVVLKEEATRIRKHQEREEKEANRKPWVAMPDRPVTAQHQYPLW